MKLKQSEVKSLREQLQKEQKNQCAVCRCHFDEGYYNHKKKKVVPKHTPCLDHNHSTGQLRGVLCSGCNSLEGKVINAISQYHTSVYHEDSYNVARILNALASYTEYHSIDRNAGKLHHTYKTEEEKRALRNKRARMKRKRLRESN